MGNDLITHRICIGLYYPAHSRGTRCKVKTMQHVGSPPMTYLLNMIWFVCMLQCLTWRSFNSNSKYYKPTITTRLLLYIGITWSLAATLISLSGDVHINPGPTNPNNSTINCLLLNAQSLKAIDKTDNKIHDLQNIVYSTTPHIVSICETWLLPEIKDKDILSESLYYIVRKDRPRKGGGVLTAIPKSIYAKERLELQSSLPENKEIVVTEIRPNKPDKIPI